jgi:hypothetical protein
MAGSWHQCWRTHNRVVWPASTQTQDKAEPGRCATATRPACWDLTYAVHAVPLCASEHEQHSCTADAATVYSAPHNSIIFTYPGNLPQEPTHCCCCSCCWCRTYSAESRQQHLGNYHCLLLLLLLKVFMLRLVLPPPPQAPAGPPSGRGP